MNQPPTLQQAAAALVAIDETGAHCLAELKTEIIAAHRDWRKAHLNRTIGEKNYILSLAEFLQADDINPAEAYAAVRNAVRPSWGATLLQTIVDFAAALKPERRSA